MSPGDQDGETMSEERWIFQMIMSSYSETLLEQPIFYLLSSISYLKYFDISVHKNFLMRDKITN